MPHIAIDYSANLEDALDVAALCALLRETAAAQEIFPVAGVRVRAFPAAHASIADGGADHGYLDISVRLRGGRNLAAKRAATAALFDAAKAFLAPAMATRSIALSLEMRDIDPELAPKISTVRRHMKE